MTLADNVLQQIEQVRMMNRKPTVFRCDSVSFDCLLDELRPNLRFPSTDGELRIFGLSIEITQEPNFEVV